jgi:hypothetical protein
MLTPEQRERADGLLGTSASDCDITITNRVAVNPYTALLDVANTLVQANQTNRENKAHRQALMKAGRQALKDLGEI